MPLLNIQLQTTLTYVEILTHSLSACNGCQNGCNYRDHTDHTELLQWEQLRSPIRLVREQLGSQGAMAVGSFHASAEQSNSKLHSHRNCHSQHISLQ